MTQCLATLVTLLAFCVEGAEFFLEGKRHFSVIFLDYIGVDAHHFTGLPWCTCFFPCIMISGWKITHEFLPTEQGFLSRAMPFFIQGKVVTWVFH